MSHSPCGAASPPAVASGRAAASATAAFPASSGRRASLSAWRQSLSCRRLEKLFETSRESASSPQAGGRHRRDSPRGAPSPTRKIWGMGPGLAERAGVGCGEAVRRGCAQARLRTPPRNWGGAIAASECRRPGSGVRRRSPCVSWALGVPGSVCNSGVLPPAAAPPTSRLRPLSNCAIRRRRW